jgi:hypothetical protein
MCWYIHTYILIHVGRTQELAADAYRQLTRTRFGVDSRLDQPAQAHCDSHPGHGAIRPRPRSAPPRRPHARPSHARIVGELLAVHEPPKDPGTGDGGDVSQRAEAREFGVPLEAGGVLSAPACC